MAAKKGTSLAATDGINSQSCSTVVYDYFDRIVIHGYFTSLSRPEQVVYFFHQVLGIPVVGSAQPAH